MSRTTKNCTKTFALAALLCVGAAEAGTLDFGTYTLHNHPDGNAATPYYGLRLDGLLDRNGSSVVTFDFDASDQGAAMFMDYDASGIRIHGQAWGGSVSNNAYDAPVLWTIDFTYSTPVSTVADGGVDDLVVIDESPANGGTISSSLGTWDLVAYAGSFGYVFQFGDEAGDGHRGFDGLSGWGWLNHYQQGITDPDVHLSASDWLFTAEPAVVPIPAPLWLFGSALFSFVMLRRREQARAR